MRYLQILLAVTVTTALSPRLVFAQGAPDYPNKVVRILVASPPGGGADLQARMFGQKLSENLKTQFVVENRPGGGDTIATGLAAKSAPDGYTLMVATASFTIVPSLYPNFPADPVKDFAPISLTTKTPQLLVVHPALPARSIKELIALARSKPGTLDMGVVTANIIHLSTAYFASAANMKITIVPYSSVAPIITDAMAGHIQGFIVNLPTVLPHAKSGRLRALGVTTTERSPALPEVPTFAESGMPGFEVSAWYGWIAPAGTPVAIVNKLNGELVRVIRSPDIARQLADAGAGAVGGTPEQFGQHIAAEVPRWAKFVKELGIRAE